MYVLFSMVHSNNLFCDSLLRCNYGVFKREACCADEVVLHASANDAISKITIHYGHLWVCANVSLSCSSPFFAYFDWFLSAYFHSSKWMKHSLSLAREGQIMSPRCTGWMDCLYVLPFRQKRSTAKHASVCWSNTAMSVDLTSVPLSHTCIQYMEMTQPGHWHSVLCSTYHRILPRLLYIMTFYWKAEVMYKVVHRQVVVLQVTDWKACEKSGWFMSWIILKDIKTCFCAHSKK